MEEQILNVFTVGAFFIGLLVGVMITALVLDRRIGK